MFKTTLLAFSLVMVAVLNMPAHAAGGKVPAALADALQRYLPGESPTGIAESVIPGVYEVVVGARLFYLTADGQHQIVGQIINIPRGQDIAVARRAEVRAEALSALSESDMVIFEPEQPKHTVTVFTDIDCGYCRKLHQEIDDYLDRGIRIRYVSYPRTGVNYAAYDKAVSVWCADDRHDAMTRAKAGEPIAAQRCDHPILEHIALGRAFSLRGTPTLVTESGDLFPGYVPADALADQLAAAQ